jgi:hypothetical protein
MTSMFVTWHSHRQASDHKGKVPAQCTCICNWTSDAKVIQYLPNTATVRDLYIREQKSVENIWILGDPDWSALFTRSGNEHDAALSLALALDYGHHSAYKFLGNVTEVGKA